MAKPTLSAYAKGKSIIKKSLKNSDFTGGRNYFADIKVARKISLNEASLKIKILPVAI
jgi:hypothetical protein